MAAPSRSPSRSKQHPLRVLIVDDSPDVLHDLQLLLELSENITVVDKASNGPEAIRLAASLQPDVVIMDLEMPGMDGYEATRRIKTQQPVARVIILSIHASPGDREQARASGADDFVLKGSSYEILRNAILGTGESSYSPGCADEQKGKTP